MDILLVENDPSKVAILTNLLSAPDREIAWVGDFARAVHHLRDNLVDLVVLDWHLSGGSGLDLLHWIRANLGDAPAVLFLTSRTFELDIAAALNAGADGYIGKPFRAVELTARVSALLRRSGRTKERADRIEAGEYVLDRSLRLLTVRSEAIELTEKEFSLASCLFRNLGNIVSRDALSIHVWGRTLDGTSRSLDTHIYRIRQKLMICPENGLQLEAVYMHGYRLDIVKAFRAKAELGSLMFGR